MKLVIYKWLCLNIGMKVLPILFKYEDIKEIYPNKDSFYSYLSRSLKKGTIKQVKKGLYALVDPSTGNIYANKFQIASHLFDDAYFSYHEALEYYGLATQSFVSRFTYITHAYVNDLDFEDVIYSSKKSECNLEIMDYIKENNVRVVSLERALIDSIDAPNYAGGLEEIELALDICRVPQIDKVIKMLEYYDKAFLYQKVGYLFEKYFGDKIPGPFYKLCLSKAGNKIRYFEAKVGYAKFVLKWRLMVPTERSIPDDIF